MRQYYAMLDIPGVSEGRLYYYISNSSFSVGGLSPNVFITVSGSRREGLVLLKYKILGEAHTSGGVKIKEAE